MIVGCGHDTAAQAITGAVGDQVHRALWQLPAVQPEAITLMDLCGCTAAEVAVRWPTRRRPPRSRVLVAAAVAGYAKSGSPARAFPNAWARTCRCCGWPRPAPTPAG